VHSRDGASDGGVSNFSFMECVSWDCVALALGDRLTMGEPWDSSVSCLDKQVLIFWAVFVANMSAS
jgi:hypothetical protein